MPPQLPNCQGEEAGDGEAGARDEELDPAELAAKMTLVSHWLEGQGGGKEGSTSGEAAVALGVADPGATDIGSGDRQRALLEAAGPAAPEAGLPDGGTAGDELVAVAGPGGLVRVERPPSSMGDEASSLNSDATSLVGVATGAVQSWAA